MMINLQNHDFHSMKYILLLILLIQNIYSFEFSKYVWEQYSESTDIKEEKLSNNSHPLSSLDSSELKFLSSRLASSIIKHPIFISIAAIKSRINHIPLTIRSIMEGTLIPDHIFIFISKEPYLLDEGVSQNDINILYQSEKMKKIIDSYTKITKIDFIFTNNIGPHRKLLPLLQYCTKNNLENVAIITADDDREYPPLWLSSILQSYEYSHRTAIVSARARRIGICSGAPPWSVAPFSTYSWPVAPSNLRDYLLLPTGTAGVLYRPSFLHEVVHSKELIQATTTNDDIAFRLASLAKAVPIVTVCIPGLENDKKLHDHHKIMADRTGKERGRSVTGRSMTSYSHDHSYDRSGSCSRLTTNTITVLANQTTTLTTETGHILPQMFDNLTAILASITQTKASGSTTTSTSSGGKRRRTSLYRSFNAQKNDRMWVTATQLLTRGVGQQKEENGKRQSKGPLDLDGWLQSRVLIERQNCLLNTKALGSGASTDANEKSQDRNINVDSASASSNVKRNASWQIFGWQVIQEIYSYFFASVAMSNVPGSTLGGVDNTSQQLSSSLLSPFNGSDNTAPGFPSSISTSSTSLKRDYHGCGVHICLVAAMVAKHQHKHTNRDRSMSKERNHNRRIDRMKRRSISARKEEKDRRIALEISNGPTTADSNSNGDGSSSSSVDHSLWEDFKAFLWWLTSFVTIGPLPFH